MTKSTLLVSYIFALLIATQTFSRTIHAKDYSFPKVITQINVHADGTFEIREERTYKFEGGFSWADLWIPTRVTRQGYPYQSNISNFKVTDEKGQLLQVLTEDREDQFYAQWFYQAQDEKKIFTISYSVANGMNKYQDVAELYWQVIGDDWDKGIDNFEAIVTLPPGITDQDQIKVFGHGPLSGKSEIIDLSQIRFTATNVAPHQFVEIRVLMPPEVINGISSSRYSLKSILAEEERFVEETIAAARKEQFKKRFTKALIILWLVANPIVFLSWLWSFYRKWKKVGDDYDFHDLPKYVREPPSNLAPALVEVLRQEGAKPTPRAFTATIFDLARRKFLEIRDQTQVQSGLFGPKVKYKSTLVKKVNLAELTDEQREALNDHEQQILHFIFKQVGGISREVNFEEMRNWLKNRPLQFQNWFSNWQKTVQKESQMLGFMETEGEKAYQSFILRTIFASFLSPLLIPTGIVLVPKLKRRKLKWAKETPAWEAFKRFLDDFSSFKEIPPEAYKLWESYLVFGILFGNAEGILKALPVILENPQATPASWYFPAAIYTSPTESIQAMTQSLNTTTSELLSASTSATHYSSGGGGGFSGGGGGGGGSGGGGAG